MVTGAVSLLALGAVVAVAAGSLPGGGDEPLLEVGRRSSFDPTPVLAWIIVFLAMVGFVLWAMSLGRPRSQQKGGKRGVLAVLVGVVIFLVLLRLARPLAETLLAEPPSAVDPLDAPVREAVGGGSQIWLFSLLLAGILAAALTRIGISLIVKAGPEESAGAGEVEIEPVIPEIPESVGRPLGDDPRSRVLRAYHRFESDLAAAGHPRGVSETTGRHARSAASSLGLDSDLVRTLVGLHAAARYGAPIPERAEADTAEHCAARLGERLGK